MVMQRGTGTFVAVLRRSGVAGKTGTSDDFRDSWFAGFDATHLAVVWVGYDDNRDSKLTGSCGRIAGVGCVDGEPASAHRSLCRRRKVSICG